MCPDRREDGTFRHSGIPGIRHDGGDRLSDPGRSKAHQWPILTVLIAHLVLFGTNCRNLMRREFRPVRAASSVVCRCQGLFERHLPGN